MLPCDVSNDYSPGMSPRESSHKVGCIGLSTFDQKTKHHLLMINFGAFGGKRHHVGIVPKIVVNIH